MVTNPIQRLQKLYQDGGTSEILAGVKRHIYYHYIKDVYFKFLSIRHNDEVVREIHGNYLYLNPSDKGISQDLLLNDTREEEATKIIREHCKKLYGTEEDVVVLEIGANKGYYAFQFADILDNYANVLIAEPDPSNIISLQKGSRLNNFAENISITPCAIGDKTGIQEMFISTKSNTHTLKQPPSTHISDYTDQKLHVPVFSVIDFVSHHGVNIEDIKIIRMDVEGYEYKIFKNLPDLFDEANDLLIFVEIHPHRIKKSQSDEIIDTLISYDFKLVNASSSKKSQLQSFDEIKDHLDTTKGNHSTELIVERNGN